MSMPFSKSAGDPKAKQKVWAKASGAVTAGYPVAIALSSDGAEYVCKVHAVATTSMPGKYGIAEGAIEDGKYGWVIVRGEASAVSGGTAGQVVTAISNAGVLTSASLSGSNGANAIGTCIGAGKIVIH